MLFGSALLLTCVAIEAASTAGPFIVSSPYSPDVAACPATLPTVRNASGLSRNESTWVSARKTKAKTAMYQWLQTLNLSSIDMQHYRNVTNGSSKNVDVAVSGGGYRSLLIGAGVIQALDGRENHTNSSLTSSVSGFLQGVTYLSGLSGGAWLVSSIIGNNYATISSLVSSLWHVEFAEGLEQNSDTPLFQDLITDDITLKSVAFDVSINDPWGRLLSYQLLNGSDGGVNKTLSNVVTSQAFVNHTMPFPILQALGVKPADCLPGPNATQYEFSPYEFGSWDVGVQAFVPTKYIGSTFSNSSIVNSSQCVTGFDNLGFVLGTSSCLFAATDACAPIKGNGTGALVAALNGPLMESYNVEFNGTGNYALYPNPFLGRAASPLVSSQTDLQLVDGGLALQNNPLWSLIQPSRNASLILTVDNSADTTYNFPNGSELLTTYVQSITAKLPFPVIPPVSTFLAQNLTRRPTLFGCANASVPTILYLANAQHGVFPANQSTGTLIYAANQTDAMISNGFMGATQNGSLPWAQCLGCFVIYEGKQANVTNTTMSRQCTTCFNEYCYN